MMEVLKVVFIGLTGVLALLSFISFVVGCWAATDVNKLTDIDKEDFDIFDVLGVNDEKWNKKLKVSHKSVFQICLPPVNVRSRSCNVH